MKNFIAAFIVLMSPVLVLAAENCSTSVGSEQVEEQLEIKTDVPKHLIGATICVKLADGKESCVPAEKFKVVARKQQFIVTKTSQKEITTCSAEQEKNRISLLAGKGAQEGLDVTRNASQVTVESRVGAIGGLQYQRKLDVKLLNMPVSVGGQLQTNESALLNVGLDF
jgi:hypothetical protein